MVNPTVKDTEHTEDQSTGTMVWMGTMNMLNIWKKKAKQIKLMWRTKNYQHNNGSYKKQEVSELQCQKATKYCIGTKTETRTSALQAIKSLCIKDK